MINDERVALFLMLGQSTQKVVSQIPDLAPSETLSISPSFDLATSMPDSVKGALSAAEAYKLFFVFEAYLRELMVDVLSKDAASTWWDKIPPDVQDEVAKLEETEEAKRWMALGSRDKSGLMTYPQLLRVIDHCWKLEFEDLLRDKSLIQEARMIGHLRNTICHMAVVSEEEMQRIRQTMRDWFRMVAP